MKKKDEEGGKLRKGKRERKDNDEKKKERLFSGGNSCIILMMPMVGVQAHGKTKISNVQFESIHMLFNWNINASNSFIHYSRFSQCIRLVQK